MTTTIEFITALFCQVDDHLSDIPKHPEAHLWPSEVVTLGLLHALKGVGNRAFYRWLTRDYRPLFPRLPERTRLFRLLKTPQDWTRAFLAVPTVLGVIDTYGIELIHPMREGLRIPRNSATQSAGKLPASPRQSCHAIRRKVATQSMGILPPSARQRCPSRSVATLGLCMMSLSTRLLSRVAT